MSIFSKILNKLGMDKSEPKEEKKAPVEEKKTAAKPKAAPKPVNVRRVTSGHSLKRPIQRPTKPSVAPMEMVDVMSKLEVMSKGSGLNWQQSIVDLLKVLGIDSSLAARKELAIELHCPEEFMGDSAKMNVWLHKAVLQEIAKNGGNVPKELLD